MMRIFLTGYMGAGKTTLGKAFAREMNVPFIDLDWYIEERFHKSIRELFTERGEASFRELERNMLPCVGNSDRRTTYRLRPRAKYDRSLKFFLQKRIRNGVTLGWKSPRLSQGQRKGYSAD